MGIGSVTSTRSGVQINAHQNAHQNFRPGKENIVESNFTLVDVASFFRTGALLAHNTGKAIPVGFRSAAIVTHVNEPHVNETVVGSGHGIKGNVADGGVTNGADGGVTDGMGVAAGAALVAAGLIAFAKSCVVGVGSVAASALLMTKQALDAARPTTATPDL